MGFLDKIFGGWRALIDVMRLDIFMDFQPSIGKGSAAVEWVPMRYYDPNLRVFLVCLLYARIISVHAETRSYLFGIIDELSKENVRNGGRTGFPFEDWSIDIGMGAPPQFIWPWDLHESPSTLKIPDVYQATLQASIDSSKSGLFGINLNMALGRERILAPASPLIAISSFSQSTDQEGVYELAVFLWQINKYYRSPNKITVGTDHLALASAVRASRKGRLEAP